MAATRFCQADFSWSLEKPPNADVITYSFIDLNVDSENDQPFQRSISGLNASPLQLVKTNDGSDCCVHISCSKPSSAQVNGIKIVSQSRTLELSNSLEGYIATVRGEKVQAEEDSLELEASYSQTGYYKCLHVFTRPQTEFQVKFLSLRGKDKFMIRSLTINIQQQFDNCSQKVSGTFDMNKLKSDIEGMGDTVSERALDFLKTMELYEQNKSRTMGSLVGGFHTDVQSSMSTESFSSEPPETLSASANNFQGLSAIMESVLGQNALSMLTKKAPQNGLPNSNGTNGNNNVYSMLQAVCGEVTKLRKPATGENDSSEQNQNNSEEQNSESTPQQNKEGLYLTTVDLMNQVDSQLSAAKAEMRREIDTVRREILSKMEEMRRDMDGKLNLILELLQRNSSSSPSSHSQDSSALQSSQQTSPDDADR